MNPEAQRIAIAEACGWTRIKRIEAERGQLRGQHPTWMVKSSPVPGYLTDLNAMHEAEEVCLLAKGTDYSRWEEYDNHLFDLCGGFARAHATAAQRAEAFLRTIGKWTE